VEAPHERCSGKRLHALVCSGRLPFEQAQREIATDWIGAYARYVRR
jgi:hypothetical protein